MSQNYIRYGPMGNQDYSDPHFANTAITAFPMMLSSSPGTSQSTASSHQHNQFYHSGYRLNYSRSSKSSTDNSHISHNRGGFYPYRDSVRPGKLKSHDQSQLDCGNAQKAIKLNHHHSRQSFSSSETHVNGSTYRYDTSALPGTSSGSPTVNTRITSLPSSCPSMTNSRDMSTSDRWNVSHGTFLNQEKIESPSYVTIEGHQIASYPVAGEQHLCLPQLLQFLRPKLSLEKIVAKFEESMIVFISATQSQIQGFIRASAIPPNAKSCPMIKRSEADKICLVLYEDPMATESTSIVEVACHNVAKDLSMNSNNNLTLSGPSSSKADMIGSDPSHEETDVKAIVVTTDGQLSSPSKSLTPQASCGHHSKFGALFETEAQTSILSLARAVTSTLMLRVYHRCFGKCLGLFYPTLLVNAQSACIECTTCKAMLTPRRFVGHTHGSRETSICHWGFNSYNWRNYIRLSRKQPMNDLDDDELLLQFKKLQSASESSHEDSEAKLSHNIKQSSDIDQDPTLNPSDSGNSLPTDPGSITYVDSRNIINSRDETLNLIDQAASSCDYDAILDRAKSFDNYFDTYKDLGSLDIDTLNFHVLNSTDKRFPDDYFGRSHNKLSAGDTSNIATAFKPNIHLSSITTTKLCPDGSSNYVSKATSDANYDKNSNSMIDFESKRVDFVCINLTAYLAQKNMDANMIRDIVCTTGDLMKKSYVLY